LKATEAFSICTPQIRLQSRKNFKSLPRR